ncbi:MAG: hypothetical protein HY276_02905 [Ignavibacteriales bacterium]|nr:hypothetical protein [Ignavibacteriales bacterium]
MAVRTPSGIKMLSFFVFICMFSIVQSQPHGKSVKATSNDAQSLINRAIEAVGINRAQEKILHYHTMEGTEQNYQSDRTYPPFFSAMFSRELWLDPSTIAERSASTMVFPGSGPGQARSVLTGTSATYAVRDTNLTPVPEAFAPMRKLNAWAVLLEWKQANDVHVDKPQYYRDYWRDVLVRKTQTGEERLFLDQKTGFPIKLDYEEKHYLWGQVHVEFIYSTWIEAGNAYIPSASFRIVDGATEVTRTLGTVELIEKTKAPRLTLPPTAKPQGNQTPLFLQPLSPDTVGVSTSTFLLRNPGYTEAITLINDTVYVFDATQAEERSRQDEAWIKKLFPGNHPVVLVVTDLAWPHIAGVRYWVAQGATVISHRMSEAFLKKVIERKWTLAPDLLEQRRGKVKFKFKSVGTAVRLAGGEVRLYAIDGIGSEGALMAYLPEDGFLWASDFIQRLDAPTKYTTEVWQATKRVGIAPQRVGAEHIGLTPWSKIESLQQ